MKTNTCVLVRKYIYYLPFIRSFVTILNVFFVSWTTIPLDPINDGHFVFVTRIILPCRSAFSSFFSISPMLEFVILEEILQEYKLYVHDH